MLGNAIYYLCVKKGDTKKNRDKGKVALALAIIMLVRVMPQWILTGGLVADNYSYGVIILMLILSLGAFFYHIRKNDLGEKEFVRAISGIVVDWEEYCYFGNDHYVKRKDIDAGKSPLNPKVARKRYCPLVEYDINGFTQKYEVKIYYSKSKCPSIGEKTIIYYSHVIPKAISKWEKQKNYIWITGAAILFLVFAYLFCFCIYIQNI